MPVYRTPDGRIIEEKTNVTPAPAGDGAASGTAKRGRESYTAPTVVRRPDRSGSRGSKTDQGPSRAPARTMLAGAVPNDAGGAEEADPVTGWLVVVEGPGVGRDARIGMGRNAVGRDRGNRVALPFGDQRISREAHIWINYDPQNGNFSVTPGNQSTNLAYLDDVAIEERMPLADGATITIGETKMNFVAFCGERFAWPDA